jgi:hypothetical protein
LVAAGANVKVVQSHLGRSTATQTLHRSAHLFIETSKPSRIMREVQPETIREHLVELNETVYPPKQVLAIVTGWQRRSFTTQEAQRVLTRLGFVCRRAGGSDDGRAWVTISIEDRVGQLEASVGTILAAVSGLHKRLERLEP